MQNSPSPMLGTRRIALRVSDCSILTPFRLRTALPLRWAATFPRHRSLRLFVTSQEATDASYCLALAFRQRTVGHMNIFSACGIRMSGSRRAISSKYNVACNATLANRADARKSPLSASVCRVCTSAEQTSFDAYPKSLRSDFPVAAFLVCSGTELVSDCTNLSKKL